MTGALPCNDRVVHHWFVGLVFEITVPTASKVWSRPRIHFIEFFLGWPNFNSSLDSICSQWTCSFEIPFVEDSLLDFRDTSGEVVKTFGVGLGTVH